MIELIILLKSSEEARWFFFVIICAALRCICPTDTVEKTETTFEDGKMISRTSRFR